MKRTGVILSTGAVVAAGAYLLGSPVAALVASALFTHYALSKISFRPKLEVRRSLPGRAYEGDKLRAGITIRNPTETGGMVRIHENPRDVEAEEVLTSIRAREVKTVTQEISAASKGILTLQAVAELEDERGLFKADFPVLDESRLTVLPSPARVREALAERKQVEAFSLAPGAIGIGPETMEFKELREFLPGDTAKRIDWKATSRLQSLVVRVFERETLGSVYILVNVDRAFRRSLRGEKVDYLAVIIAQLVAYFRRFGHSMEVVEYDRRGVVRRVNGSTGPLKVLIELGLKRERGLPALMPIQEKLRLHGPPGKRGSLITAASSIPSGSYAVIIDDAALYPEEMLRALELLRKRGVRTVVIYPNPVLFVPKGEVTEENLEVLYNAYRERKKAVRGVKALTTLIEVGPRDLLPKVVREL